MWVSRMDCTVRRPRVSHRGRFTRLASSPGPPATPVRAQLPQPFDGYYFRILAKQGSGAKGGAGDYIVDGKMTGGFENRSDTSRRSPCP